MVYQPSCFFNVIICRFSYTIKFLSIILHFWGPQSVDSAFLQVLHRSL